MKIIDNRDFLISKIESKTNTETKKLTLEHEEALALLKEKIDEKKSENLEELKLNLKKSKERIKKQEASSFDLFKEKSTIKAQSEVFDKVVKKVEEILSIKGKARTAFFNNLAKRIEIISDKEITHFLVPKGVTIKGKDVKEELNDISIIGVISQREEIEINLKSLLEEKSVQVGKIIKEELF